VSNLASEVLRFVSERELREDWEACERFEVEHQDVAMVAALDGLNQELVEEERQ
jgi:hypothetical protein